MSMCLSFGGNREDTIEMSVVNEEPSSVRVKLKNETQSPGEDEGGRRAGAVGVMGVRDELAKALFFFDVGLSSASSSLKSGVGIPMDRTVGTASFPTEFLRDERRPLLRISSGNATNLTIFRAQTSALSSDNPTHVKSGSSMVTSVSSEDTEVAREEDRKPGLVGDSNSVTLGEWCRELVRERVITVPVVEWKSRSNTEAVSSSGDAGVDRGEGDSNRPPADGYRSNPAPTMRSTTSRTLVDFTWCVGLEGQFPGTGGSGTNEDKVA